MTALPIRLACRRLIGMTTTTGETRSPDPAAPGRGSIPMDTFPGRLKLARLHAGNLTIMEAAAKCGLLNQNWSNWENGKLPRDLRDVVLAISEGLGVDRDWLMYGGPLATPPSPRSRRGPVTVRYRSADRDAVSRPKNYPDGLRRPGVRHHPIDA